MADEPSYGQLLHAARSVALQWCPGYPPPEHTLEALYSLVVDAELPRSSHGQGSKALATPYALRIALGQITDLQAEVALLRAEVESQERVDRQRERMHVSALKSLGEWRRKALQLATQLKGLGYRPSLPEEAAPVDFFAEYSEVTEEVTRWHSQPVMPLQHEHDVTGCLLCDLCGKRLSCEGLGKVLATWRRVECCRATDESRTNETIEGGTHLESD